MAYGNHAKALTGGSKASINPSDYGDLLYSRGYVDSLAAPFGAASPFGLQYSVF
jgi:hypothetical protein